jgi:Tol biopolymer transport system component
VSLAGDDAVTPLTRGPFRAFQPELSPDGQWVAYRSNESGSSELYLRRASDTGGRWPVPSSREAIGQRWSTDGRELMYLQNDTLYALPVVLGEEPSFGTPRPLLAAASVEGYSYVSWQWDVSPDGSTYLFPAQNEATAARQMIIMLNWLDHLRREQRE